MTWVPERTVSRDKIHLDIKETNMLPKLQLFVCTVKSLFKIHIFVFFTIHQEFTFLSNAVGFAKQVDFPA